MDTFKNQKDTERTNAWLKSNGISVNQIYAGTAELFQAQKLASTTLRDHGGDLGVSMHPSPNKL